MSYADALAALRTSAGLRDLARRWDETRLQVPRDAVRALLSNPLLPSETVLRAFTGDLLACDLRDEIAQEIFVFGATDFELSEFELTALRAGQTACDVGAHIGYHTQIIARATGPDGHVLAFEPTPRTCKYLDRNVSWLPQVEIHAHALGDTERDIEFLDYGPGLAAFNSMHGIRVGLDDKRLGTEATALTVRQRKLDDVFAERDSGPHYVKIDVESAEMAVLHGMEHILRHARPTIALEVGDFQHLIDKGVASTVQLIDHLGTFGYRPFEFSAGRLKPHQVRLHNNYDYMNLIFIHQEGASPGNQLVS